MTPTMRYRAQCENWTADNGCAVVEATLSDNPRQMSYLYVMSGIVEGMRCTNDCGGGDLVVVTAYWLDDYGLPEVGSRTRSFFPPGNVVQAMFGLKEKEEA